jgi:hypothetical protein
MPDESSVSSTMPDAPPPPAPAPEGAATPAIDRAADKRYSPRKKLDQLLSTRGFGVVVTLFFVVPTVVLSFFGFTVLEGQQTKVEEVLEQNFNWVVERTVATVNQTVGDEFDEIDTRVRTIVDHFADDAAAAGPALRTIPESRQFSYITGVYIYDGAGRLVYPLPPEAVPGAGGAGGAGRAGGAAAGSCQRSTSPPTSTPCDPR